MNIVDFENNEVYSPANAKLRFGQNGRGETVRWNPLPNYNNSVIYICKALALTRLNQWQP